MTGPRVYMPSETRVCRPREGKSTGPVLCILFFFSYTHQTNVFVYFSSNHARVPSARCRGTCDTTRDRVVRRDIRVSIPKDELVNNARRSRRFTTPCTYKPSIFGACKVKPRSADDAEHSHVDRDVAVPIVLVYSYTIKYSCFTST